MFGLKYSDIWTKMGINCEKLGMFVAPYHLKLLLFLNQKSFSYFNKMFLVSNNAYYGLKFGPYVSCVI